MKGAKVIHLDEHRRTMGWCCDEHKKGYLLLASERTLEQKRIALDVLRRAEKTCQNLSPNQLELIRKETAVFL